jgi:hypothetical protein
MIFSMEIIRSQKNSDHVEVNRTPNLDLDHAASLVCDYLIYAKTLFIIGLGMKGQCIANLVLKECFLPL